MDVNQEESEIPDFGALDSILDSIDPPSFNNDDGSDDLNALLDGLGVDTVDLPSFESNPVPTSQNNQQKADEASIDALNDILSYLDDESDDKEVKNTNIQQEEEKKEEKPQQKPQSKGSQIMGVATSNSIANKPIAMEDEADYFELLGDMINPSTNQNQFVMTPSSNEILAMLDDLISPEEEEEMNNNNQQQEYNHQVSMNDDEPKLTRSQSVIGGLHRDSLDDMLDSLTREETSTASSALDSILINDNTNNKKQEDDEDALMDLLSEMMEENSTQMISSNHQVKSTNFIQKQSENIQNDDDLLESLLADMSEPTDLSSNEIYQNSTQNQISSTNKVWNKDLDVDIGSGDGYGSSNDAMDDDLLNYNREMKKLQEEEEENQRIKLQEQVKLEEQARIDELIRKEEEAKQREIAEALFIKKQQEDRIKREEEAKKQREELLAREEALKLQRQEERKRKMEEEERLAAERIKKLEEEEKRIEEEIKARNEREKQRREEEERMQKELEEKQKLEEEEKKRLEEEKLRKQQEEQRIQKELEEKKLEAARKEEELRKKIEQKRQMLLMQQQEEEERKRKETEEMMRLLEEEQQREEKKRRQEEENERRQMEEKGYVDELINQLDTSILSEHDEFTDELSNINSKELNELRNMRFPYAIDLNEIQIFELLGGGTFGSCYRSIYKNREVIVKKLNCNMIQDQLFMEKLKEETSKICILRHPQIIDVKGISIVDNLALITDYIQGTPLFGMLRNRGIVLDISEKLRYAQQIAMGLSYLHKQEIIFSGLKTKNILINSNNDVILRDFGLLSIKDFGKFQGSIGTPQYSPPEIIQFDSSLNYIPHDYSEDIYSFGIVLWEIFSGKTPFQGLMARDVCNAVCFDGLRPDEPLDCPIVLWKVMQSCWHHNPENRPSIDNLLKILNQPIENIMRYGLTTGSTEPAPRGAPINESAAYEYKKQQQQQQNNQQQQDAATSSELTKIHMVLNQIKQLILSNNQDSQLKALKVLINIGRTESNIQPIIDNDIFPLLHTLIKLDNFNIQETSARVLSILCEWPKCEEIVRQEGIILSLVQNLSSSYEIVVLQSAKALIVLTKESLSQKAVFASGGLQACLKLLDSPNDMFVLQGVWLFSHLLECDEYQMEFHQHGGLRKLLTLLSSTNPGIQFRVLVALGNLISNPQLYPVIEKAAVLKRFLLLLNSNSPILRLQAVSFFYLFISFKI